MTDYEKALALWQRKHITTDAELAEALNGHSISFAYHSGKLENENITYHDTREIFEHDGVTSYTGDLRTLFEIRNAKEANELFLRAFRERRALDEALTMSSSWTELSAVLRKKGYVFVCDPYRRYATIRSLSAKKCMRTFRLGAEYDKEALQDRLLENQRDIRVTRRYFEFMRPYTREYARKNPPTEKYYRQRDFFLHLPRVTGYLSFFRCVAIVLGVAPLYEKEYRQPLSAECREACRRLDRFTAEITLVCREHIETIKNRIEAIKRLTEELFQYSIVNSAEYDLTMESLSINNVLEESILEFYGVLQQQKITPNILITENKIVRKANRIALSRIFSNLMSNAIKYSDGDLEICLTDTGKIIFSNSASDLNDMEVERLFDRFYTVENARKSTGLGLSISRILIGKMNGEITAQYKNGRLSICVQLPEN